jgi:uncharacterized membrane protein
LSQASPLFSRTLTVIAAAVLAFDGVALAALGWWGRRPMLVLIGVVFFVSSGLVFLYWRWYQKRVKDIADARRDLAEEAREIQRALREK